jgi:TRAP-type C4-dicarboxylate transport system substrate-binding protein
MRSLARSAAALCVLAAAAVPPVPVVAQEAAKPVALRFATTAPQKTVWGMQLERSAALVAEESGGALTFEHYFGGQLGGEAEIVQQVARGRLDGGAVPLGFLALLVPELQLLGMPAYFRDQAELDCVLDGPLRESIAQRLARRDIRLLGWGDAGTMHLVGRKPYLTPAELGGVRAGSYGSRMGTLFWQGLGANVASVGGPELASAFQTGLIDVAMVVPTFYVAAGVNRAAPTLMHGALGFAPTAAFVNQRAYDRMTDAQRAALDRSQARQPPGQMRAEVREFERRMLAAHEQGGGRTVALSPQQVEAFRTAVTPLWPRMVAEAGPEGPAFFAQIEAARKACPAGG